MEERFWDFFDSWEQAEEAWDKHAKQSALIYPLDIPKKNPCIPQIATGITRFLSLKAFSWVVRKDSKREFLRFFFQKPLHYSMRYLRSLLRGLSYTRRGNFFYYNIQDKSEMQEVLQDKNTLLLVGFSYCEKPKECPSVRFSNSCIADEKNPICRQCFIAKVRHALPRDRTLCVIIPTINFIGEEIIRAIHAHPNKNIIFLIASCEFALTMFGHLGNMIGIRGIGIRLQGRVCNTMKAFALSEEGIKPGMTWLSFEDERKMLELIRYWRELVC